MPLVCTNVSGPLLSCDADTKATAPRIEDYEPDPSQFFTEFSQQNATTEPTKCQHSHVAQVFIRLRFDSP